jgi:hypothetical protein
MLHKLDAAIEVIVTLQSTYLAVVSIDVAAVSNEGNSAMKTLSASATILLPLSLIASLMGQITGKFTERPLRSRGRGEHGMEASRCCGNSRRRLVRLSFAHCCGWSFVMLRCEFVAL